jgi:hypothetical protein
MLYAACWHVGCRDGVRPDPVTTLNVGMHRCIFMLHRLSAHSAAEMHACRRCLAAVKTARAKLMRKQRQLVTAREVRQSAPTPICQCSLFVAEPQ